MFRLLTSLFFFGVLAYVLWTVWNEYRKQQDGTWMDKLWAAMKQSATIFWNKFVIILAAVVAQLDNIADFLNMPQLKDYINLALSNPKTVALIMLIISSISIFARLRPGSNDPLK